MVIIRLSALRLLPQSDVNLKPFFALIGRAGSSNSNANIFILVVAIDERRCLTGVDTRSQGLSEFVPIDEEANHEIVHALRLGEAQRATDEPFDPRP